MSTVTRLLESVTEGKTELTPELFERLHQELRRLADREFAKERPDHTLQPTALVNEAFVRLVDADIDWKGRVHFLRTASRTMRRVLVDLANARKAQKRGEGLLALGVEDAAAAIERDPDSLLDLDGALSEFEEQHPIAAELVVHRFFGGHTHEDAAKLLDIPITTADRHWAFAKAWLRRHLRRNDP